MSSSAAILRLLPALPLGGSDTMTTTLQLYEALKGHVGEEAARMIAEALPLSDRVVTESYLDARLGGLEARLFRWMLGFFATLWLSNVGVIVTLLVKV